MQKIQAYPFKTYAEREASIKKADKKELARIKRESIAKTRQYALAGNSITISVLVNIFRTMFLDNQPENQQKTGKPVIIAQRGVTVDVSKEPY